ncbi:MAG: hypothetical protein AAF533_26770 [Acidobacteriota bacterium]
MSFRQTLEGLPLVSRLFRPARPSVAVELTDESLTVVRSGRSVDEPLSAYFHAEVPAGTVQLSPVEDNLPGLERLVPLVKTARSRVAPSGIATALCLPDVVARVAILTVDRVPRKESEVQDMVAWRLKKSLPYPVEEAATAWQAFPAKGGRQSLLTVVIRRRILSQYEELFASAGLPIGMVTLRSLVLAEALPETTGAQDQFLLSVGSGWFSILITDGQEPIFFRCKPLPEAERHGAERDWFVSGELVPTVEYYRRKLAGQGLSPLYLQVAGPGWADMDETLRTTLDMPELLPARPLPQLPAQGLPVEVKDIIAAPALLATRSLGRSVRGAA